MFVFRCTVQTSSFGTASVLTWCNRDIKGDKLELGWFMFSVMKATCQLTSAVRLPWLSFPSLLTAVCLCLCNLSARSASEPQTKHNAKSPWSGTRFSHTRTHTAEQLCLILVKVSQGCHIFPLHYSPVKMPYWKLTGLSVAPRSLFKRSSTQPPALLPLCASCLIWSPVVPGSAAC